MVDTQLLLGGVSNSNSSYGYGRGRRSSDRLPAYQRRSDAIAYGSPYQKAAALVDLVCSFYYIYLFTHTRARIFESLSFDFGF